MPTLSTLSSHGAKGFISRNSMGHNPSLNESLGLGRAQKHLVQLSLWCLESPSEGM